MQRARLRVAALLAIALVAWGQEGSEATDKEALLALKASLGSPQSLSGWTADGSPCATPLWKGVTCTDSRVTKL